MPLGIGLSNALRRSMLRIPSYPKDGLVALYEFKQLNDIPMSEDFTSGFWAKNVGGTAAAPTVTPNNQLAPDGTMTASTVYLDITGRTATTDFSQLTSGAVTTTAGQHYNTGFWLRTTDGTTVVISVLSGLTGLTTPQQFTVTPAWQFFEYKTSTPIVTVSTGSGLRIRLREIENTSITASLAIWHPQSNAGPTINPYVKTDNLQTVYDTSRSDKNIVNPDKFSSGTNWSKGTGTTWDSTLRRMSFGPVGTHTYALWSTRSLVPANRTFTHAIKVRGDGTAAFYSTDSQIGSGSNPGILVTLTNEYQVFHFTTTYAAGAANVGLLGPGFRREAAHTATWFEYEWVYTAEESTFSGFQLPRMSGFLGTSATGVDTGDAKNQYAGMLFENDDFVTVGPAYIGSNYTVIAVASVADFNTFRILSGTDDVASYFGFRATTGQPLITSTTNVPSQFAANGPANAPTNTPIFIAGRVESTVGATVNLGLSKVFTANTEVLIPRTLTVLGRNGLGGTIYMNGVMYTYLVYNRVLSDIEIERAYNVAKRRLAAMGVMVQ